MPPPPGISSDGTDRLSHLSHQWSPISSEATPPLYPHLKLGAITSSSVPLTTFHFMIAFLAFYIVFFFTFPWNLWRSVRHAAGVQETAARLKDGVNRVGHHSKNENGQPRQQGN